MLTGNVVVSALAQRYGVSEETIRRDLERLEAEGYARKTYGGAVRLDNEVRELPYTVRKQTNVAAKKRIAERIATLIHDGDSVMLDASTTALFTVQSMAHKHRLTVITNSVEILVSLPSGHDWHVVSTGGRFEGEAMAFYGDVAQRTAGQYYADYAILSCKGLDRQRGISDTSEEVVELKRAMMASVRHTILGVDHSKLDKVSLVHMGELDEVHAVVTDVPPSEPWRQTLEDAKILLYDRD